MINITNLTKEYNKLQVIDIPSFQISKGERIGLLGNNGAGKTTLLRMLLDLEVPTSGEIEINGENVRNSDEFKKFTGAFLDRRFLIEFLKAEEYFEFVGLTRNLSHADIYEFLDRFSSIFNNEVLEQNKYLRDFSMGNAKKVGLVGSLIGEPGLQIWDEPFSNLDPQTQLKMKDIILHSSEQKTWVISSHNLNHIFDVATRIVILEKGYIQYDIKKGEKSLEDLVRIFQN